MKIQHLIPILFLAAFYTVSAQTNNTPANPISPSLLKQQKDISLACAMTMTNILHELQGLAQQFPPPSDIGPASIEQYDEPPNSVCLRYSKNTHFEKTPRNINVAEFGRDVADKGGAKITIFVYNVGNPLGAYALLSEGGSFSSDYPLIMEGQKEKLRIRCYLTLNSIDNPTDLALEKAVNDVVKKQADILRKTIQGIVGNDIATANSAAAR